jgi:hypothetical protein
MCQNKLVCEYICDGACKGFADNFLFYEPKTTFKLEKSYGNISSIKFSYKQSISRAKDS